MWYAQKDGLAMGASLEVILANLWISRWNLYWGKRFPKFASQLKIYREPVQIVGKKLRIDKKMLNKKIV